MRVLFVCMGNICRSPTAEGVFRALVERAQPGLVDEIDSAGTHDYHVGEMPDRRTIEAAGRRGIDLTALRARTVDAQDFERFDYVLAMDRGNLEILRARAPGHVRDRVRLVMDFAPGAHSREVPDPYYGGTRGFEEVLDLLEQAAEGLLREIAARTR